MSYSIIDIPGYNHTSESIWHPMFREYLSQVGYEVTTLDLPGGKYPQFSEWYPIIASSVDGAKYPVVLVGHSLGTRAVLRFIEQSQMSIEAVILIAPFDNTLENALFRGGNYANFFDKSISINTINPYIRQKPLIIGSLDDQNIPYAQAQNISRDLDAELMGINNSSHFLEAKWAKNLSELIVNKLAL